MNFPGTGLRHREMEKFRVEPLFALRNFLKDRLFLLRFERQRTDHPLFDQRWQRDFEIGERWAIEADEAGALRGLCQVSLDMWLVDIGNDVCRLGHRLINADKEQLNGREASGVAFANNRCGKVGAPATDQNVINLQASVASLERRPAIDDFAHNLTCYDVT